MSEDTNHIEELKIIQDIITRMSNNSFSVKKWTISLVTITLLLKGQNQPVNPLIAIIPLLSFWFLDAYYLFNEKKFRYLYDKKVDIYFNGAEDTNVSFDISFNNYSNEPDFIKRFNCYGFLKILFNKTIIILYGLLLISILLVYFRL